MLAARCPSLSPINKYSHGRRSADQKRPKSKAQHLSLFYLSVTNLRLEIESSRLPDGIPPARARIHRCSYTDTHIHRHYNADTAIRSNSFFFLFFFFFCNRPSEPRDRSHVSDAKRFGRQAEGRGRMMIHQSIHWQETHTYAPPQDLVSLSILRLVWIFLHSIRLIQARRLLWAGPPIKRKKKKKKKKGARLYANG